MTVYNQSSRITGGWISGESSSSSGAYDQSNVQLLLHLVSHVAIVEHVLFCVVILTLDSVFRFLV